MRSRILSTFFLATLVLAPGDASAVTYHVAGEISAVRNFFVADQTIGEEVIGQAFRFDLEISGEPEIETTSASDSYSYEANARNIFLDGVEQPASPMFPGSARFVIDQSTTFNIITFEFAERFSDGNPRADGNVFRSMGMLDGVLFDRTTTALNTESDRFSFLDGQQLNVILRFQHDNDPFVPAFDAGVPATFTLVPEPSTACLIGLGLLSLAARRGKANAC